MYYQDFIDEVIATFPKAKLKAIDESFYDSGSRYEYIGENCDIVFYADTNDDLTSIRIFDNGYWRNEIASYNHIDFDNLIDKKDLLSRMSIHM